MIAVRRRTVAGLAGPAALAILLGLWSISAGGLRASLRERALDLLLPGLAAPGVASVAIVDIDRAALLRFGPWPWPRARLARLVQAVAAARPSVLAIDILLAGPDRFTPASLAERTQDGDALLAEAVAAVPSVLGFAVESGGAGPDLPSAPVLLRGQTPIPDIWRAGAVVGPTPTVAAAAQGFGALVAAADADGLIRRVPLLLLTGETLRPGLALEAVRLSAGAGAFVIDGTGYLHAGTVSVPLGPDAALRLVQRAPSAWASRTVPAAALLEDTGAGAKLAGRIVLIGSSAPELGGLRVTPASPLTPSVQLHAEAIEALLRGGVPYRPAWLAQAETAAALALGALGLLLNRRLRPLLAAGLTLAACLAWSGAALAAVPGLSLLVDPAGPPLVALAAFACAALARFAHDEWRARLLRASFEQHLAPDVVKRIAADPAALRLRGELREITALFTDIEGFTSMTERAEPTDLVALLDLYFDAAARIVTAHGGMVEKIVGDAVHAIFNAPFALEAHPERAVACALALLDASEAVRVSPLGQRLRLGRTRIGIETGAAIVGDVGGSRKLDYTAHGNAMNTAARLEASNKELGSSICIGPGAAARLDPASLRQIGTLVLRGQSRPVDVFTPAVLWAESRPDAAMPPTPRPP